jgi:nucleotide-binding universal stress UspA family protein
MPTILLATDLTAHGDRALDRAALLAAGRKAGLTLVHVVSRELRSEPAMQAALAEGEAALGRYVAESELPADLRVTTRALSGEPDTAIVQAAREAGAELVVLGGANADLLERLFRRNVLHQVVRNAPCPVLVVHRRAKRAYRRLLVATDLSLPARRAFEAALRGFPGAEVTLLHVARTETPALGADDVRLQLDDLVTASLARLAAEGAPAPAKVTTLVETGGARETILAAVARLDIDLAVVGTLGLGGAAGLLLGSTAEALIGALRCDVLAVKDQTRS